jgi:hypothetical protein
MTTGLAISAGMMLKLQIIAKEEGTSPQLLGEKAIRRYLRHETRRKIRREEEAFRAMHTELLAAYPGEYVAIYRGQVVDRDPDQFALYRRIEATYADAAVLIRQITLEPQETYVFRSPRVDES